MGGKTKKRGNRSFINFGVPEEEDLTVHTQRKGWDRTVCTVGNTRCSLLAFVILSAGLLALIGGGAYGAVVYLNRGESVDEVDSPSAAPSISFEPTFAPTAKPTRVPSIS